MASLTAVLRDPKHHPYWLPAVLDTVRVNAEITPNVLQAAIVVAATYVLPPLPSMAFALWEAILDGVGLLVDWIPRGCVLCVEDHAPPAWRAVSALTMWKPEEEIKAPMSAIIEDTKPRSTIFIRGPWTHSPSWGNKNDAIILCIAPDQTLAMAISLDPRCVLIWLPGQCPWWTALLLPENHSL